VVGLAKIHPIKLEGIWEVGFALDVHTISSQFIGYDELGRERFQTERSVMGDLLYRLKYQSDIAVIPEMMEIITSVSDFNTIDVIVPVPPSNTGRKFQPVIEVAKAIGLRIGKPVHAGVVQKIKRTTQLKNVGDVEERKKILQGAFRIRSTGIYSGKTILLFDDLYQSGATLSAVTSVLYDQGKADSVKVLTLTKTRSSI
jgi:predicted amidophosphoribosyltransferase